MNRNEDTDRPKNRFQPISTKELRIGITGSPATGKKSVARELARLTGYKIVLLNDIAIKNRLTKREDGELAVDVRDLRRIDIETRGKIVVGHLLPYVVSGSSLDFVAILRCSPQVLINRYRNRGYSEKKISANIEGEILDLLSYDAFKAYGRSKVAEFDTTRTKNPRSVARRIILTVQGKRPKQYGAFAWSRQAARSVKNLLRITSPH